MEWVNDVKSIAQIAMPVLIAIVIPYFRRINQQLQELNKQMALNSASMEYITKELEKLRDRQHRTDSVVQKVALVQERCKTCNH